MGPQRTEQGRGAQCLRRVKTGARGLAPERARLELMPRSQVQYSGTELKGPDRKRGVEAEKAKVPIEE